MLHKVEKCIAIQMFLLLGFLALCLPASAAMKPLAPGHYVYAAGDPFSQGHITNYLNASSNSGGVVFRGVQQTYYWKSIETSKGQYDFTQIDNDIATINGLGRGQKLIIQFSYKSFTSGQWEFPNYIHNNGEGVYGNPANGGTGNGYYVTDTGSHYPYVWNTAVQARFQACYQALANHLDGNATLVCINNSETASGQAPIDDNTYGDAIRTIFVNARSCFSQTRLIQYANGPKSQLTKWADACIANNIGWGGPDIRPTDVIGNPGLEPFLVGSNSSPGTYAFYWNYWGWSNVNGHSIGNTCVKGSAVQTPDYDWTVGLQPNYTNATQVLHVNYMFWRYLTGHETDIINFVKGKVDANGVAGGLNTTVPTGEPTAPDPVTNLNAAPRDGEVLLTWTNPTSDPNYEGTMIRRSYTGYPANPTDGNLVYQGTATSFTDTGRNNGTEYFYSAWAYSAAPEYSTVAHDSCIPADTTAPGNVTNVQAVPGVGQIALTWSNPTDPDFAGVRICRSTVSAPANPDSGQNVYEDTGTSYTDTSLTNGIVYYYSFFTKDEVPNWKIPGVSISASPSAQSTYTSIAADDGYVIESTETSNTGGSLNATLTGGEGMRIGDTSSKQQYKAVISFNTAALPDNATITSAQLKMTRGGISGDPSVLGTIRVDICKGSFSGSQALQNGDFQAAATQTQVATMNYPASDGAVSTGNLNSNGCGAINKTGITQLRVYFATDDDNDAGADYLGFYPGDNATDSNRPKLVITYN